MPVPLAAPTANATAAFTDMLRAVVLLLPKMIAFIAILIAGWLVARLLLKVVHTILQRTGFDRLVERGGIHTALAGSRYTAGDIIAKLVYYAVLLVTLQLAFGIWGPNPVSDLITSIVAWLPKAFVAILIIVVAAAIASTVRDIVTNALGGLPYGRALANLASWLLIGLGIIAALNQIGVATTVTTPILIAVLATIAGILIVGVGGGLVAPMQQRWDGWLERAAEQSQTIAEHAKAYNAARPDAEPPAPTVTGRAPVDQAQTPAPPPTSYTPGRADPTPATQPTNPDKPEPTQPLPPTLEQPPVTS
ncbi:mechanosensitive ion channel family protein [Planosporangium mesophilum]|uniref:Uncharacterized protein n=1 Tax=Planosporangium mesophilum TaxID=689768 RepID=A0A8J3TDE4_9ACTN|nr:hypothetical protein [Planosporangium mesophilum]NJC84461.1 hypothetical protein [Planosporangium mesophilum]GII23396.1 hypothetical protein Pme01_29930 [Planosporangium mesophilum]